jgi:hypothetical protein
MRFCTTPISDSKWPNTIANWKKFFPNPDSSTIYIRSINQSDLFYYTRVRVRRGLPKIRSD